MKSEPKAFASLSSGLLARKGAARPAMRPQGFGQSGAGLEDLGWNDMGFEAPKPSAMALRDASHDAFGDEIAPTPSRNPLAALTPVQSPVHSQQAQLVERLAPSFEDEDEESFDYTAEAYEGEQAETPVEADEYELQPESSAFHAQPHEAEPVQVEPVEPEPPVASTEATATPVETVAAPVASAARRAPKPRAAAGSKAKAAFTLRLDPARHLRLRLACAVGGRSAQQLVTDALDALLAEMPELDAMAAKANRKG